MAGNAYPRSEVLGPGTSALGELVGNGSSAGDFFNLGQETSAEELYRRDTSAGDLLNWNQARELPK